MKPDWLVKADGICSPCKPVREWHLLEEEYRLYRFLTEVEDTLRSPISSEEETLLSTLRKLVRKLVLNCYAIKNQIPEVDSKTGTALVLLYDELGFPLTIQLETNLPGTRSSIHNHGTWGIIAVLQGEQKNTFWQRDRSPEFPDKIEYVGERILAPDEIISFTPEAIHQIEAVGNEPTVTLNLYGETEGNKRFEFDRAQQTAKRF